MDVDARNAVGSVSSPLLAIFLEILGFCGIDLGFRDLSCNLEIFTSAKAVKIWLQF